MSSYTEQLKKDLEELIAKLLTLSIETYENLMNIILEFIKKASPVPIILPQIVIPEHLKKKSVEEAAKLFANLICAPLNPEQALRIVKEIIQHVEKLKSKYEQL